MKKKSKDIRIIYIIFFLFLFNFVSLSSQTKNWSIVDIAENIGNNKYFSLKCADSLNCIVLGHLNGYGGFFIRSTTNGGQSWEYIYMDSSYNNSKTDRHTAIDLYEIEYPDPNLMIAIGDSGLILRSTNKGDSWETYSLGKNKKLFKLRMLDETYGIMGCVSVPYDSASYLYETTDGGLSWAKLFMPAGIKRFGIDQIDIINRYLFVCTNLRRNKDSVLENSVLWIHDSWQSFDSLECPPNTDMDFIDENYGWVIGNEKVLDSAGWESWKQKIYHTEDGGKTWTKQRDTVFEGDGISGIKFFDENFGMVTGYVGLMLITTDGGKKWKEEHVKVNIPNGWFFMMQSVQIPSITTAFVIGNDYYIYKYSRDWTDVIEEKIETDFDVSPNPAVDFIEIDLTRWAPLAKWSPSVEISIFNVLGEIQTTPSRLRRSTPSWKGWEKVRIDVSGLAPGMYFIRIGDRVGKFIKF